MPHVDTKSKHPDGSPVRLHYTDWGTGKPVIFIHGWPSDETMWEYQLTELPKQGLRCIAYTRRGFGKSCAPWDGYDYDTLASDLNDLINSLKLDKVALVGFSMGGGEVARYMKNYGAGKISKVILVSTVLPFMLKRDDNQEGVPKEVFDKMAEQMKKDRAGFLDDFYKQFFGVGLISHPVTEGLLEHNREISAFSSARAQQECATAFASTDFRNDLSAITVPTLIIHGDKDKTVPIDASSARTAKLIAGAKYKVYEGAPHGLFYTERDQLNTDIAAFI